MEVYLALLLLLLIVIIFFQFQGKSQRDSARLKLKSHHQKMKEIESEWNKFCDSLAKMTNVCSKCYISKFKIWELQYHSMITRCESCKKKTTININSIDIAIEASGINKSFQQLIDDTLKVFSDINRDDEVSYSGGSNVSSEFAGITKLTNKQQGGTWYRNLMFIPSLSIENNESASRNIPKKVKDFVFKRDNGCCVNCGSQNDIHFDHIIPHSKGGSNTVENIQILCATCNLKKGAKIDG